MLMNRLPDLGSAPCKVDRRDVPCGEACKVDRRVGADEYKSTDLTKNVKSVDLIKNFLYGFNIFC